MKMPEKIWVSPEVKSDWHKASPEKVWNDDELYIHRDKVVELLRNAYSEGRKRYNEPFVTIMLFNDFIKQNYPELLNP